MLHKSFVCSYFYSSMSRFLVKTSSVVHLVILLVGWFILLVDGCIRFIYHCYIAFLVRGTVYYKVTADTAEESTLMSHLEMYQHVTFKYGRTEKFNDKIMPDTVKSELRCTFAGTSSSDNNSEEGKNCGCEFKAQIEQIWFLVKIIVIKKYQACIPHILMYM